MLCDIDQIFKTLQNDITNSPKETKKAIKNAKKKVFSLISDSNYNIFGDLLQQMKDINIVADGGRERRENRENRERQ
jgi:hypothetical protein